LIQIHNNTYVNVGGFYHTLRYTFAEAELVKAVLQLSILTIDFAPKRLACLYFCTSFSTCRKC